MYNTSQCSRGIPNKSDSEQKQDNFYYSSPKAATDMGVSSSESHDLTAFYEMLSASFGVLSQNTGFYPSLDRIVETMLGPLNLGPGGGSYNEPISRLHCSSNYGHSSSSHCPGPFSPSSPVLGSHHRTIGSPHRHPYPQSLPCQSCSPGGHQGPSKYTPRSPCTPPGCPPANSICHRGQPRHSCSCSRHGVAGSAPLSPCIEHSLTPSPSHRQCLSSTLPPSHGQCHSLTPSPSCGQHHSLSCTHSPSLQQSISHQWHSSGSTSCVRRR